MASISSRIKGNEIGTEIKLYTMKINISETHLHVHPTKNHFLSVLWVPPQKTQDAKVEEYRPEQNRTQSLGRFINLRT